jgi:signal transduction histidine kinase/DNA-binding NarL/FixJ family response regulator
MPPLFARMAQTIARNGGAGLGLCGIILLWGGVFHSLSVERKQLINGALQNTANLSRAFAENIVRSIKMVDGTLLYIRDSYENHPADFNIADWTERTQALTDMTFQIGIIGKTGMMKASNFPIAGGTVDLSDREHFRVHRDNPGDTLFISKPVLGRVSHRWSLQMTRKLIASDGSFDGVVVISLDPLYLSRFYKAVDLGRTGHVILTGTDGVIRALGGPDNPNTDELIGNANLSGPLLQRFARQPEGNGIIPGRLDQVPRITSYRGTSFYPLIVSVSIAESEVLENYQAKRLSYTGIAAVITIVLLSISILITLRQVRLRRAQEQLAASRAGLREKSLLLEMTLEHISQGIMMVDPERRVLVCNQRAMQQLDLPRPLLENRPLYHEIVEFQAARGEFGDLLDDEARARLARAGDIASATQIYERERPDGAVLEISSTPLPNGGAVRTFTDVTERTRTLANLRAARDAADLALRAKSEFLATMSHEIRSPMSGLIGVLELLRDSGLSAEQEQMAGMVNGSARSLLAVLNDILDFSKIEAGAFSLHLEPFALRDCVNQVTQPHIIDAARKGVTLSLTVADAVPDWIETDPLRLRQILNNLLSNAVKFTAAGTIHLNIDTVHPGDLSDGGTSLRCCVSDTGIGMTEEVLAKLFQPFTQADGSTSRTYGGTGLGLCISRQLAGLLNGDLHVTSQPGHGSSFTVRLPYIIAEPAALAQHTMAPPQAADLSGRRVLVVDDDPTNRWLTQRQLRRLGLNVEVAEHGEAGLALVQERFYDLVVTDCHMPRMDGVALTRAIRASDQPTIASLVILGLTADVTIGQEQKCRDAGMTDVAIKPLSLDRMARLILRFISPAADLAGHAVRAMTGDANTVAPAASIPAAAVFDEASYHDLYDAGDPEGVDWLRTFLVEAATLIDALPSQAADVAHETLHRLAGAALSVGAIRLGQTTRAVEHAVAAGETAVSFGAIRDDYACAADTMHDFMARETAAPTM